MTWTQNNVYDVPWEDNLGIHASGQYGFDTVGLGYKGGGGPSLSQMIVGGIASPDYFLGK
jgi:hypothetical protein